MDLYYADQAFNRGGPKYYTSSYGVQAGTGIGSIFRSILRWIQPIAASGAKKIGKQALTTGVNILSDLNDSSNQEISPKEIMKKRLKEGVRNLQGSLIGKGIGTTHKLRQAIKRKNPFVCPQMQLRMKKRNSNNSTSSKKLLGLSRRAPRRQQGRLTAGKRKKSKKAAGGAAAAAAAAGVGATRRDIFGI